MNDAPRQKLREIIRQHGRGIVENPRRVENLLRDYCGEFRREISVLTMALEEHAVADLLRRVRSAAQSYARAAGAKIVRQSRFVESAARWSIESWAWAFGLISDAELANKGNYAESKQS